jgi:hypothetical protein
LMQIYLKVDTQIIRIIKEFNSLTLTNYTFLIVINIGI